jgi:hypothetical protein
VAASGARGELATATKRQAGRSILGLEVFHIQLEWCSQESTQMTKLHRINMHTHMGVGDTHVLNY